MNETQIRQKIVDKAVSYLGAAEGSAKHKEIVDIYNSHKPLARGYALKYTDAWCSGFASAMAIACGMTDIIPTEVGCGKHIDLFRQKGRWQENDAYVPKAGDFMFYDWDDSGNGDNIGGADHVGIVTKVEGNTITVIEGNKGTPGVVGYRTMAVNGKFIRGYGIPDYASKATKEETADVLTFAMPILKNGSKGGKVKALQALLKGYGYGLGVWGVDGDFGAATDKAVKEYQKKNGLVVDGIVGKATWTKLLG